MIFDLFFRVGPAIQAIFELGYEPKEELFYELTPEQYSQLEGEGKDVSKTWYTIIPKDQKYDAPELLIIDADEKSVLMDAVRYINSFCVKSEEKQQFSSFEEKLEYAASKLPTVFSQSSKYTENKKAPHLKIIK